MKKSAILFLSFLFSATPALALPKIQEVTSPGGLKAWLVEDHAQPLIAVHFAFKGGVETDPADRQGLATLATSLLTQGAGPYDARAFQEELANASIVLSLGAGRDFVVGQLKTLRSRKEKAFDLLSLALTAPRFEEADIARLKDQQLTRIRFQLADTDWQARRALFAHVFDGHSYGFRALGTRANLAAISREDLRAFVRQRMARDNALIVAVGDLSAKELGVALDKAFGALPVKAAPDRLGPAPWPQNAQSLCVLHRGDQADLFFAAPMLTRADPDWYAALVANYILGGGGFESRLMAALRAEEGLTYGISTALADMDKAPILIGGLAVDKAKAATARALILKVWHDLHERGATNEEVAAAKAYLIGSWGVGLTSRDKIAAMLLALRQEGLDATYLEKRKTFFENVSRDDVNRVLRTWFDPARLSVAVTGAGDDFSCDQTIQEAEE